MIQADFHIHTTASDGRLSPNEIVLQAASAGLTHISITDHDTIDGLLALDFSVPSLTVLPGIEFSTDMPDCEIHILGYGFELSHPGLRQQISLLTEDRLLRVSRMVDKLTALGYPVTEEHILRVAKNAAAVGRPHVAKALVEKGYFSSIADVFETLLNQDKPGYVPHYKLTPAEVIRLIHQAGGKSVLAHPGLVGNDDRVRQIIELGIQGLEVYHPKHTADDVDRYSQLATKHGILISGGSDFHAIPGRYPERLGLFTLPSKVAESLIRYFGF